MINITNNYYHLTIYSDKSSLVDYFRFACYTSFRGTKPHLFKEHHGLTSYIVLDQDMDLIFQKFKSNYRNEIRKAISLGIECSQEESLDSFISYYNDFASKRNLTSIKSNHVLKYNNYIITQATYNNIVLTYHTYIMDEENKIVRLLYSASNRLDENIETKVVGYANKLLHYKDFELFKNKGYLTYDFAGICDNPKDKVRYGIGQFKKGFGGELVKTRTYYSPIMYIVLKLRSIFI